ncbi:MAG: hypothetical protein AAB225_12935 [Acidobacteriota bacterium]
MIVVFCRKTLPPGRTSTVDCIPADPAPSPARIDCMPVLSRMRSTSLQASSQARQAAAAPPDAIGLKGALVQQRLGDLLSREDLLAKSFQRRPVEVYAEGAQLGEQFIIGEKFRMRSERPSSGRLAVLGLRRDLSFGDSV